MNDYLNKVAIVGAAGKMGSGISLLFLQEMSLESAKFGKRHFLKLIDTDEEALAGLKNYLRKNLVKFSEKNIILLREIYKEDLTLVNNEEIIDYFISKALEFTNFSISIEEAKYSHLVLEAVVEDIEVKVNLLKNLAAICPKDAFFLTNTSSIPIDELSVATNLKTRLVGFHFYNPPAIQKLLEIILPDGVSPDLAAFAENLARRLNKTVVYSGDVAGFIGNGHFIPEVLYSLQFVDHFSQEMPQYQAIYLMDIITKEFLVRPMGIFQLIDYVGIDVVKRIIETMGRFLKDSSFCSSLLDEMIKKGIRGGQYSDGSQKDGFFSYEQSEIQGVYNLESAEYEKVTDPDLSQLQKNILATLPKNHVTWKKLKNHSLSLELLTLYFEGLFQMENNFADIAKKVLSHSVKVSEELVNNQIAHSMKDVTTVLKEGFFHLYGPDFVQPYTQKNKEQSNETI